MNVFIVAAGKSKRFKDANINTPKFLLKLNKRLLVENIFLNFDKKTKFTLIVNRKDFSNYKNEFNFLKKKYNNLKIFDIPSHNLGPAKSLTYVQHILENNTLITYCDFLVEWDYKHFTRYCFDKEIVVPIFKGFQPASLGENIYDYIKNSTNNKNKVSKIQVKESFTRNRINEPGVAGSYYFKNINSLKNILSALKFTNKEIYLSHIIIKLLNQKHIIHSYKIEKFLCLGTPVDYYQYKNFENYFNKKIQKKKILDQMLIPMAGSGTRMKKDNFQTIKPYITVENKPMYYTALNDHPKSKSNYLVTNREQFNKYNSKKLLKNNIYQTIDLEKPTKSQIHTCLEASSRIDPNKNILISSCDYGLSFDIDKLQSKISIKYDVLIWVYKLKNLTYENKDGFAYCKTLGKGDKVSFISEKKTISENYEDDYFLTGTFLFKKAEDFFTCIQNSLDSNEKINNEYYIGNSINSMIKKGKKVFIFEIDSWASFGTPLELQIYYYWSDYFYKIQNEITK
jgi:bifunctional N-acetylglucosamine-1-phosphate-uridyltransferase/glucosamine-1-phosphate-acetyltransferase GlmU-like protein